VSEKRGRWGRLYHGETSVDFYGRRRYGFIFSGLLVVVTIASLVASGLNLGIDFEGGVAWQVPSSTEFGIDEARSVVEQSGVDVANAKIQTLQSGSDESIRIQVGDQSVEVRSAVQQALATKAGVDVNEVSVSSVSSSWGRSITEKAVRALIAFLILVSLYIAWRFEWRMALAAIIAMLHDVLISVGIYSGDRGGLPHHSRILLVRHHRRLRQGQGQHRTDVGGPNEHGRHHQRVDESGVDAIAQHEPRRGVAGVVSARPRLGRFRCGRSS
jgi:hypothetical protein